MFNLRQMDRPTQMTRTSSSAADRFFSLFAPACESFITVFIPTYRMEAYSAEGFLVTTCHISRAFGGSEAIPTATHRPSATARKLQPISQCQVARTSAALKIYSRERPSYCTGKLLLTGHSFSCLAVNWN